MMALIIWNQCASKRTPRPSGFILAALLSCCVLGSSGQLAITPDVPVARVGQTVTLYIHHTLLNALTVFWYKGGSPVSEANEILTYGFKRNKTITGKRYNGNEAALPDGSLRITGVWRNQTGYYTVRILLDDGQTFLYASVAIGVYDVLTPPTLVNTSGSGFSGEEFTLQCQAGGLSVERYSFLKDAMNVTCDQQRINCSEPSSFLSFHPIKESDSGSYTCTIYNPVSLNTSLPLGIIVRAVPISNVTISSNVTSGGLLWENEDSVQLTCAAHGSEPVFSWMHNGGVLPQNSRYNLSADNSSLTISLVNRKDTGPFRCIASNSANNMSSVIESLPISWRPNGLINCGANNISDMIQFSCSWPGGNPPASVQMVLSPLVNTSGDNEVSYNASRRNITTDITLSCNGFQETRTSSCSLNLGFPYSPNYENHSIFEPTEGRSTSLTVILGSSSSMRESSMQILPANFTWYNGSSITAASGGRVTIFSNESFSQKTISQVTVSDSGAYYCLAENLMGTTNFSFLIKVQPQPETTTSTTITKPVTSPNDSSGSGGLSGGAIAGIVIGAVALVVLIGVTVYCVLKNKKGKKHGSNSRPDGARFEQGAPNAMPMNDTDQKDDMNYAVLNFNNNQQVMPPDDNLGASESLYAQVKK